VGRSPEQFGYSHARWRLTDIRATCTWLRATTLGGVQQVLRRLGIHYKRGRDHIHSPDVHYAAKRALIAEKFAEVQADPQHKAFLYADQVTYYRQPTLASAYALAGPQPPLAERSHAQNTSYRIMAALDALTGQVTYRQRSRTDIAGLVDFWYDLRRTYPTRETIYVVVDNWPVLFHPDVLAPLQDQHLPWPPRLPANWPTEPSARARHDNLPIQLLCLPTYASWLNPIEKLWRKLRQEVLHLHRHSDDWPGLRQRVANFLNRFEHEAPELLRYVGLIPN
jgi:hypothetical protein